MFNHNFWYWLMLGVIEFLNTWFTRLPIHSSIGFADLFVTMVVYSTSILLFFVGSFFHLRVFGAITGTILLMETARMAFAIWEWIKSVLPLT